MINQSYMSKSETPTPGLLATLTDREARILIADDQIDVLAALRLLLKSEGYQTEAVTSPGAALEAIGNSDFDLVLMDLNYARDTTSGREGLDLLARIRELDRALPVVVMTAWGSIELAVEAVRGGGGDFIQKPWENAQLLEVLGKQLERGRQLRREQAIEDEVVDRRTRELAEAREIQRRLLPKEIPQVAGCEIAATWQPAHAVGGDYFDVLKFGDHEAALCLGDVIGKGLPAALLMSNLQAAVRSTARSGLSPRDLCARINQILCDNMEAGKFVTFFYGVIETRRRRLVYCNAGHNAPILARADGSCLRLVEGGPVLGLMADAEFQVGEVDLQPGDRLALFTDGITEAWNENDEEFGEDRVVQLICADLDQSALRLQKIIMQQAMDFALGHFTDDATLMVVKFV